MVSARIYIEGGGDNRQSRIRCREGFRKLLEKSGFAGRMPNLIARGGRDSAYDSFKTAHAEADTSDYVALLVDSEDPVQDINRTWTHLSLRDRWERPTGAEDDQALLMTTCMETWIVADRQALSEHFDNRFRDSALPPLNDLEKRTRQDVQNRLERATRDCHSPYSKGQVSFEVLSKLNPDVLEQHLPSFRRARRILNDKLR